MAKAKSPKRERDTERSSKHGWKEPLKTGLKSPKLLSVTDIIKRQKGRIGQSPKFKGIAGTYESTNKSINLKIVNDLQRKNFMSKNMGSPTYIISSPTREVRKRRIRRPHKFYMSTEPKAKKKFSESMDSISEVDSTLSQTKGSTKKDWLKKEMRSQLDVIKD